MLHTVLHTKCEHTTALNNVGNFIFNPFLDEHWHTVSPFHTVSFSELSIMIPRSFFLASYRNLSIWWIILSKINKYDLAQQPFTVKWWITNEFNTSELYLLFNSIESKELSEVLHSHFYLLSYWIICCHPQTYPPHIYLQSRPFMSKLEKLVLTDLGRILHLIFLIREKRFICIYFCFLLFKPINNP